MIVQDVLHCFCIHEDFDDGDIVDIDEDKVLLCME